MTTAAGDWRKASHSGPGSSNCVEVGQNESAICVRDAKDSNGAVLPFDEGTWRSFLTAVKSL